MRRILIDRRTVFRLSPPVTGNWGQTRFSSFPRPLPWPRFRGTLFRQLRPKLPLLLGDERCTSRSVDEGVLGPGAHPLVFGLKVEVRPVGAEKEVARQRLQHAKRSFVV